MKDDKLKKMDLPKVNQNETLETISRTKFKLLLDISKFEIRSESERDKGIDFSVELKNEGCYTNFRFNIQLKSSETKEANADGSFSIQIETSNINYLLNGGLSAYYIFYDSSKDLFYFEDIKRFVNKLYNTNNNWNEQQTHTLRFNQVLNQNSIENIYNSALEFGKRQREINERLAIKSASLKLENRLVIDADLNVTEDEEIRELIENLGLDLLNEGKWSEIISVHKKASGNIAKTAKYNLILGIAYYYMGHLSEALSFFKTANKLNSELSEDLQSHLCYFELSTKYSIGILSIEEYLKQREIIENDLQTIINHPKANANIKLNAKSEMVLFEGYKNNTEYVKDIALLNALELQIGISYEARKESALKSVQANQKWLKNVDSLKKEALESKNYFSFYTALINQVKVLYQFTAYSSIVKVELDSEPNIKIPDDKDYIDSLLEMMNGAFSYFNQIGHINNLCASLTTIYEILHYKKDFAKASEALAHLENLVRDYDINEQKKKLEFLKENGTTHEHFKSWIDETFSETKKKKQNFISQREELMKIDEEEVNIPNKVLDGYKIQLFPIGYFHFPKPELEKVFQIINAENSAKQIIKNLLAEGIIPVVNIYYNSIKQEGFVNGHGAQNEINGWANIYRIRKSFSESKFYRIFIN